MVTLITEAREALTAEPTGSRYLVRLIDAGQGSSGIYPASTLKQAAADRVFPAGTHCYLDHPSKSEDRDRPERTVKDLAAVLATDARYDTATESLVAEARVFAPYRPLLDEIKEDIGMSIRAWAESDSDGIITRLVEAESVDFVTKAGRGGKVIAVLESATEAAANDRRDQLEMAVQRAYADPDTDRYAHLRDYDETRHLVWFYADNTLWEQGWEPSADDTLATLTGDRTEVRAVTTYVPANLPATPAGDTPHQEAFMPQIDETELTRLRAAESTVSTLESERDTTTQALTEAEQRITALEARVKAANQAAVEASDLPAPAKARVTAAVESDPAADVAALIKAEQDYIAALTPAPAGGFGHTIPAAEDAMPRVNAWGRTIEKGI